MALVINPIKNSAQQGDPLPNHPVYYTVSIKNQPPAEHSKKQYHAPHYWNWTFLFPFFNLKKSFVLNPQSTLMNDTIVLIVRKNVTHYRLKSKHAGKHTQFRLRTSSGKQSTVHLTRKLCFGALPSLRTLSPPNLY